MAATSNNTTRDFKVSRNDAGVAQVKAETWIDAIYALGYMHATDRPTQLLFARAVASGRAAELISDRPDLRETDRFFRRIGLHEGLATEAENLDPHIKEQIAAYCDGINDGVAAGGRSLPMWATGFRPDPWDAEAVLLVGQLLSFGGLAIGQMQNERLLLELIHAGADDEGLRDLYSPRLDSADFDMLRNVHMSNQLSNDALETMTDLPRLAGSNAWAIRGERTECGAAILCSDPHLEVNRLPGIWYETVLQWGDNEYVMGATLPGCPLFAVGRTPNLAWGVTYMKGDTIDFFIEDCREGGETGWQYRRGDDWFDFEVREEEIAPQSKTSETVRVLHNEIGVLESDPGEDGMYLSVAWTGSAPGSGKAMATWLDVIASPTTKEAMDVVRQCPQPTLCFVFADLDDHVGLQGTGRFPKRPNPDSGLAPLAAWDESNHWQGFLDNALLPSFYDPAEGFVATANEGWNPEEGPLLVTQLLPDYRKRRIDERLAELPSATVEEMQALQYDVINVHARDMLPRMLPHLPDGEIKTRLGEWDFSFDIDSKEAVWYQRLYINLIIEVFGHEKAIGWRRIIYLCTRGGYSNMIMSLADRVLLNDDSVWWHGRDRGDLVRTAYQHLVTQPEQTWGDFNYFHFSDRFFGRRRVGRLLGFDSGKQPMPGCSATPFQGHVFQTAKNEQTFAPSYHFIAEMNTHEAWTNLPGGPSESRFSRYYKSDVDRWKKGEYKRLSPEFGDEVEIDE